MRQALQIFVGWLTAPRRCQAPTAETTKRRIRLALEPQISSPPSSILLFSPHLSSPRVVYFGLGLLWWFGNFICKFINSMLVRSDQKPRKSETARSCVFPRFQFNLRIFRVCLFPGFVVPRICPLCLVDFGQRSHKNVGPKKKSIWSSIREALSPCSS